LGAWIYAGALLAAIVLAVASGKRSVLGYAILGAAELSLLIILVAHYILRGKRKP
jgi:hypothetical protein